MTREQWEEIQLMTPAYATIPYETVLGGLVGIENTTCKFLGDLMRLGNFRTCGKGVTGKPVLGFPVIVGAIRPCCDCGPGKCNLYVPKPVDD